MPIFRVDLTADPAGPRVVGPDRAPVPAINDFLSYLEHCTRSPYTIRAYARGLAHFVGWLHEAGVDIDAVTRPVVGQYIGARSGVRPRAGSPTLMRGMRVWSNVRR
jgi:site-specific recombinase XerD